MQPTSAYNKLRIHTIRTPAATITLPLPLTTTHYYTLLQIALLVIVQPRCLYERRLPPPSIFPGPQLFQLIALPITNSHSRYFVFRYTHPPHTQHPLSSYSEHIPNLSNHHHHHLYHDIQVSIQEIILQDVLPSTGAHASQCNRLVGYLQRIQTRPCKSPVVQSHSNPHQSGRLLLVP